MKKFLIPSSSASEFKSIALISLLGILLAGTFGILHDQITYTMAPSYYHKFKFIENFKAFDFGWHPRLFAATVGFFATWWAGMIIGWILGRVIMHSPSLSPAFSYGIKALCIVFCITISSGVIGWLLAQATETEDSLQFWKQTVTGGLTQSELSPFRTVGYIHNFGYIGSFIGTIVAVLWVKKQKRGGEKNI